VRSSGFDPHIKKKKVLTESNICPLSTLRKQLTKVRPILDKCFVKHKALNTYACLFLCFFTQTLSLFGTACVVPLICGLAWTMGQKSRVLRELESGQFRPKVETLKRAWKLIISVLCTNPEPDQSWESEGFPLFLCLGTILFTIGISWALTQEDRCELVSFYLMVTLLGVWAPAPETPQRSCEAGAGVQPSTDW
jgi:hypothetical protein